MLQAKEKAATASMSSQGGVEMLRASRGEVEGVQLFEASTRCSHREGGPGSGVGMASPCRVSARSNVHALEMLA
jgi:hypothetical protein